jgi:hypothetical protein
MAQRIARTTDSKKILNQRNKIYLSLLAALIGVVLFGAGYYLAHVNQRVLLGDIIEKVGEFLLLIVSLHFMYEWLVKDFDREEYIELLQLELDPQIKTINEVNQTLNNLYNHTKSVLNLASYSDMGSYEARWKNMAERFDNFWLIGDVPVAYLKMVASDGAKRKIISVYRTVNERNRSQIVEAMTLFDEKDIRKVKVFHIGRFDWGFTIIASNQQGNEVEVLLNYNTNPDGEPTGYYVFGNTAVALRNSIRSRLEDIASSLSQSESERAMQIDSEDMLGFILSERLKFISLMNEARQGIPISGEDNICQQMSSILSGTQHSLDVTHIARGDSINLLDSSPFKDWLEENYSAAKRGVKIKRIFLIQRGEVHNPILKKCAGELKSHAIEVKYCILEDIGQALCKDFSIYDNKALVYISPTAGGAWKEERTEARYSCNQTNVQPYKELFIQLDRLAKPFS